MNPSELPPPPYDSTPQRDAVRTSTPPRRKVGLHRSDRFPDEGFDEGTPRAGSGRGVWRLLRVLAVAVPLVVVLAVAGFFGGRVWMQRALRESLPAVDGRLVVPGLHAPVTVLRDAHGVPHLRAGSMDDLVFAQGYVTAQDRLWQMDALRRHAAGELAEILGKSLIEHDRAQRTLQIRAAADRALPLLPADERHWLDAYANGVNAAMAAMEGPGGHLPLEFRLLRYEPKPWTARDSLLVGLAMVQDLSTSFPDKLDREAVTAKLSPEMVADLYPVGSWRDHPPTQPVDLTAPRVMEDVPLDESQTGEVGRERPEAQTDSASQAAVRPGVPAPALTAKNDLLSPERAGGLLAARQSLALMTARWLCEGCLAGSNGWAVAGSRTQSGKPMLSSDMHLRHGVPGIWYEADLEAPMSGAAEPFHVAGVTLPGTPFVIVGHNQHVAWAFTNLFADVQDVYVEQTRGTGDGEEFQGSDGAWHPVLHRREVIRVHGGSDVVLDVTETQHGSAETPIISGPDAIYPQEKRTLAVRWAIYDPTTVRTPFFAVDAATDWASMLQAISNFDGPAQNMMYADDQGHIGYHAVGKIPVRGAAPAESLAAAQAIVAGAQAASAAATPTAADTAVAVAGVPGPKVAWTALSPVPTDGRDPKQEWTGYIPFDQLPQVFDPTNGVVETANARITPDDYPYPVTLDWSDPYRQERIWKVLSAKQGLVPADMLALETDVYSDLDRVVAERLAYAIDHAAAAGHGADGKDRDGHLSGKERRLRQAADLMRKWDGTVAANEAAPAIVDAARAALWPLILAPQFGADASRALALYSWGSKAYAEEQIIVNQPVRWLPARYANWNELLAAAVEIGMEEAHAPEDVSRWQYGPRNPVDIEHPIFAQSPLLEKMIGMRTGTGALPQSGDGSTVKQVTRTLGPSERMTVDFGNLDGSTLNVVLGESMNPASEWFMDQWKAWYTGTTFAMPFSDAAADRAARHRLVLAPQ